MLSMIIQAGVATSFWLLALGVGMRASWVDLAILTPLIMLVMAVPISVGSWGVREAVMVTAPSLLGISASSALAISVEFGLVMILAGLPGGLIWLFENENRSYRDAMLPPLEAENPLWPRATETIPCSKS
jgi:uncharacterized membrane protein YbhN (UPF0104 family)